MNSSASAFFQALFTVSFLLMVLAGVYLWKNDRKLFGKDPAVPGDHESGRAYNRMQVYVIWFHLLLLTAAFAVYVH